MGRIGRCRLSIGGDRRAAQEAKLAITHSVQELSRPALDGPPTAYESALELDPCSSRTYLRPPSYGDERQAYSIDWPSTGEREDRAEESDLQLSTVFSAGDSLKRANKEMMRAGPNRKRTYHASESVSLLNWSPASWTRLFTTGPIAYS